MVTAIAIMFFLVAVLAGTAVLMCLDLNRARRRIGTLDNRVREQSISINALTREVKTAHARLVDGLWQRVSVEVEQEIEKARARGRERGQG